MTETAITLDDHVDAIIEHRGPVLATKRVTRSVLEKILIQLHVRIQHQPELAPLAQLRPYDFSGTNKLWTMNGENNYALAREVTDKSVQKIMRERGWTFIQFVQEIDQDTLYREPINAWGTHVQGMVSHAYKGRFQDAIIDLVRNDEKYREYRDLRHYDFKKGRRWTRPDAYEAMHMFIGKRLLGKDRNFINFIRRINKKKFTREPINRYGTTLMGMLSAKELGYNDSYAQAILDLIAHDGRYSKYRDIRLYDFDNVRNVWTLKDGTKNNELAREMTGAQVENIMRKNQWSLWEFLNNINHERFAKTRINRYGTTAMGMLNRVYGGRYARAIVDWLCNADDSVIREQYARLDERFFQQPPGLRKTG